MRWSAGSYPLVQRKSADAERDHNSNTDETTTHGVILTDAAAAKAKALLDQEGRDDLALRIAVQPGGCAGLRYQLFFDDRASTAT